MSAEMTQHEKDLALEAMGFVLDEHPVAVLSDDPDDPNYMTEVPCRVCGYNRRYAAFPDRCLFCEARQ